MSAGPEHEGPGVARPATSVVVATCDRPDALARCLDALASGTLPPDEIVVVDQGFGAQEPRLPHGSIRVVVVPQERLGLSAARNGGVARASGDIVAVTDDDCVPAPGWLAAIVGALTAEEQISAVTGPVLPLGAPGPDAHAVSTRASRVRRVHRYPATPWNVGTGANFATHRRVLVALGGYDERLGAGSYGAAGEDIDLLYRLIRTGASVLYEPEALVFHERQTSARRRRTRRTYGRGVGAFCALRLRERDRQGALLLVRWIALRLRLAARATIRADWRGVRDEALVLAGTATGLVYGARAGPAGGGAERGLVT
jgi:GT2 family glycosyltransferase